MDQSDGNLPIKALAVDPDRNEEDEVIEERSKSKEPA